MSSNSNSIHSNSQRPPKVALVHDYLGEFGGAERVLEALCEIWPKAPIYTAFYRKGSAYDRFNDRKIITSWAQKVPFFTSYLHSPLRFLAPLIWNSFDFSDFDVIVSSSSWYVTRGFKNKGKAIEICYCHTPPRYLYGYQTSVDWQKYWPVRLYALIVNHFMRVYDYEAAQRVDWFIANSREVQARIKKFYRRDSTVIYPPVDVGPFARKTTNDKRLMQEQTLDVSPSAFDDYFLVVSRLVGAKNVDLAVKVCKNLKLKLKVVGVGRELDGLRRLAESLPRSDLGVRSDLGGSGGRGDNMIEFVGDVDDEELIRLYQNCRAVIFPASQEDFGLVPVEAMAAGKPVIALAEGGVLETVIDGKTGVYFNEPQTGSLGLAINKFIELEKKGAFDPRFIKKHAEKFSKERFKKEILEYVIDKAKIKKVD